MQVDQLTWGETAGWIGASVARDADLVLYFGSRDALRCGARYRELRGIYRAPTSCDAARAVKFEMMM